MFYSANKNCVINGFLLMLGDKGFINLSAVNICQKSLARDIQLTLDHGALFDLRFEDERNRDEMFCEIVEAVKGLNAD